jgi:hypothetical protein
LAKASSGKHPGGRPRKTKEERKSISLAIRVREVLRNDIHDAANKNGRSISEEAEYRLVQSFDRKHNITDALAMAYGPRAAGLAVLLIHAMNEAGATALSGAAGTGTGRQSWVDSPYAFEQARQALDRVMTLASPEGSVEPSTFMQPNGTSANPADHPLVLNIMNSLGRMQAERCARTAVEGGGHSWDWTYWIPALLGDLRERLVAHLRRSDDDDSGRPTASGATGG